ncbi:hypothetical protein EC973_002817 [Apophysomyces ossiformis]|uniref:SH3 domain-containing protein n=1 Tax=Apophysomyces ossiformis TaxID=679940 RepID=A0A8H7BK66_9FUNG|nr:hypothetical protein EC973_002817 [Apophysomyces ossiformis]
MMSNSPAFVTFLVSIATIVNFSNAQPVWPRAEPTETNQHSETPKPTPKESPKPKAPTTTNISKEPARTTAAPKKETQPTFANATPSTEPKSTTKKERKPHTSTALTSANTTPSVSSTSSLPFPVPSGSTTLSSIATTSNGVIGSAASQDTPSSSGPSGGAIGGIVAAVLIAVGGLAAFAMVKRKKKRSRRMTKPDPFTMGFGSHDPPPAIDNNFPPHAAYASMNTVQTPQIQVPPIATATSNPSTYPQMAATTTGAVGTAAAAATTTTTTSIATIPPVPTQTDSIGVFTVISTYTPTLNDEIDIQIGDRIEVLVEYDDGWCQGINLSRGNAKGVFPKHCVDYATDPVEHDKSHITDETDRVKRVSSMYMAQKQ